MTGRDFLDDLRVNAPRALMVTLVPLVVLFVLAVLPVVAYYQFNQEQFNAPTPSSVRVPVEQHASIVLAVFSCIQRDCPHTRASIAFLRDTVAAGFTYPGPARIENPDALSRTEWARVAQAITHGGALTRESLSVAPAPGLDAAAARFTVTTPGAAGSLTGVVRFSTRDGHRRLVAITYGGGDTRR